MEIVFKYLKLNKKDFWLNNFRTLRINFLAKNNRLKKIQKLEKIPLLWNRHLEDYLNICR